MSEDHKTHDAELPDGSYFEHKAREEEKERQRAAMHSPIPCG